MANVAAAISYVLSFEDSTLSGIVTTDSGGRTRFGIAEKFHPDISSIGFYSTMNAQQALGAAMVTYLQEYCVPLQIASTASQAIANKLLSLAVNAGPTNPVKWLQEAVGAIPDGAMGPATIAAVNKADPGKTLADLKQKAVQFYEAVAKGHPEDAQYLQGWINRANA